MKAKIRTFLEKFVNGINDTFVKYERKIVAVGIQSISIAGIMLMRMILLHWVDIPTLNPAVIPEILYGFCTALVAFVMAVCCCIVYVGCRTWHGNPTAENSK